MGHLCGQFTWRGMKAIVVQDDHCHTWSAWLHACMLSGYLRPHHPVNWHISRHCVQSSKNMKQSQRAMKRYSAAIRDLSLLRPRPDIKDIKCDFTDTVLDIALRPVTNTQWNYSFTPRNPEPPLCLCWLEERAKSRAPPVKKPSKARNRGKSKDMGPISLQCT